MTNSVKTCGIRRGRAARHAVGLLGLTLIAALPSCGGTGGAGPASASKDAGGSRFQEAVEPSLISAARQAEATYDYEAAAGQYFALMQRNPGDRGYTVAYARNLRYLGRGEEAVAVLTDWLRKNQPDGRVLLELGKAYLAADRLALAEKFLQQSLEKDSANWDTHSSLGVVADYQGNHALAQSQYLEALKISPDNPVVLNNLGLSRAQSGDVRGAVEALRRASDQPSAGAQVRQNLALVLALSGDLEGAERLARKDLPPDLARQNMTYFRHLSGLE